MLNIVDGGCQRPLGHVNDAIAYVLGDEPAIVPDDADDGNIDVGEDIGGRAVDCDDTHHEDEYGQYHEGIRPT